MRPLFLQFLSYMTPQTGGLSQLSFGLLHQQESIRERALDLLEELRLYPVRPPIVPGRLYVLTRTNLDTGWRDVPEIA